MSARSGRTFRGSIILLLAGPVLWTAHFLVAYFFVEVACAAGWLRFRFLGTDGISLVTVLVTLVAAALSTWLALAAFRSRNGPHGDLAFTGSLLSVLATIVIVFVGISPAFHEPC